MEVREILRELVAENVTEGVVISAVRDVVIDIVRESSSSMIDEITREILMETEDKIVREAVASELSKPVKKDDGWGNIERYESFEQFFRSELLKETRKYFRIERIVGEEITKQIEIAAQKMLEEFGEKELPTMVIKSLAAKGENEEK